MTDAEIVALTDAILSALTTSGRMIVDAGEWEKVEYWKYKAQQMAAMYKSAFDISMEQTERAETAEQRLAQVEGALHRISLGSQNSGTSKEDLGIEARAALATKIEPMNPAIPTDAPDEAARLQEEDIVSELLNHITVSPLGKRLALPVTVGLLDTAANCITTLRARLAQVEVARDELTRACNRAGAENLRIANAREDWRKRATTSERGLAAAHALLREAEVGLGIFLGEDNRFSIAVGGNPIAVARMLDVLRALATKIAAALPEESSND